MTAELEMVYWRIRVFAEQLIAQPVPATVAATLVAVGYVGDTFGYVSDTVASVLLFVGVVGLAYVGSGSLDR
ncbi:hypothetical protein [Haloterrigena alkaliphila]|uniref:hypothetical protein n=1 Tax=Haloterrigena alkaliphila TaxID=2816475 RepID=UPI001CEC706F|nr:hypothetical protein [Haloterrigena alkaliphila]UHQ95018.1 hypothetical protein J0X25_18870 [Haloterrigena alkaliphila]